MAADMRAETGPGASGWARGSHTCSGTAPAFEAEPDDRQHERRRSHPRSEVRAVCGDHGEGLAPGAIGQQHQRQEQRRCPELGHHRVPLAGPLHLVADAVVGEHQQQRRHRHQLPEEQEGADGRRGRHEQQRRDEEGQHARRGAAGKSVARGSRGERPWRTARRPPRWRRRARRADRGEERSRAAGAAGWCAPRRRRRWRARRRRPRTRTRRRPR